MRRSQPRTATVALMLGHGALRTCARMPSKFPCIWSAPITSSSAARRAWNAWPAPVGTRLGRCFQLCTRAGCRHAVAKSALAASRRRSHGPNQATSWRHTPRRPEATDIPRAIPRTTDDICGHGGGTLAMKMRDASEMGVLSDSCTEPDSRILSDRPHVHCET